MCLAVLVEIIALIWNIVTFCACCCKKYIIHPLVAFAFLIAILHLIALIIYGLKYKDQIGKNIMLSVLSPSPTPKSGLRHGIFDISSFYTKTILL